MLKDLNANSICSVLISPIRVQHSGNTDNPIGEPDRAEGEYQSLSEALKKVKKHHRARKGHFVAVIAIVLKTSSHTLFIMPCIAQRWTQV